MNYEPCTRCPPFVVRCGHLGEKRLRMWQLGGWDRWADDTVHWVVVGGKPHQISPSKYTRAEADAEFTRRECALLESAALLG